MKSKQPDCELEILNLGWDTESTSDNMRAMRGGNVTGWHPNWRAVLDEIRVRMGQGQG